MDFLLAFVGMPGHVELLIIAGIFLILFGNRIPSAMHSLGRGIRELRKGLENDDESGCSDPAKRASGFES